MLFSLLSGRQLFLGLVALITATLVMAKPVSPETKPVNPMNAEKPQTVAGPDTYEIISKLKVNGRLLGPQRIIASGQKTHIAIFRESANRQYQVTYQINTVAAKDMVSISTAVTATVFSPSFQLMSGQHVSARQTPELPEMEVIVSARKLPVKPAAIQPINNKMPH